MSYIKHFKIYSPKILNPKRVLVLSDLHIGASSDEHMNELIREVRPKKDIDLILIAGDVVHSTDILDYAEYRSKLVNNITRLSNDRPTFICAGNHDQMVKGLDAWRKSNFQKEKELLNAIPNVTFLENSQVKLDELTIGDFTPSIEYYVTYHEKPLALLNEYHKVSDKVKFSKETYNILLSHDPKSLLRIAHSPHGNLVHHSDLVVSGHTHDGLVPYGLQGVIKRGFVSPQRKPLPKYSMGSYKCKNTIYIINGAVNPLVESPLVNNMLGVNYTLVDLERGPKLTYTRES